MPYSPRSMARMVMPTLLRHGWRPTAIRSYLRQKGYAYARRTMAMDLREMQNSYNFGRKVMAYPKNVIPVRSVINETTLTLDRKYKVVGRATVRDVQTGKLSYPMRSFYTDELQTLDELAESYIMLEVDREGYKNEIMESFQVLELLHNVEWPY